MFIYVIPVDVATEFKDQFIRPYEDKKRKMIQSSSIYENIAVKTSYGQQTLKSVEYGKY
jgi:hypothetical protein